MAGSALLRCSSAMQAGPELERERRICWNSEDNPELPSLALNLNFSLESPQQRWRDILAQSNKVPQPTVAAEVR